MFKLKCLTFIFNVRFKQRFLFVINQMFMLHVSRIPQRNVRNWENNLQGRAMYKPTVAGRELPPEKFVTSWIWQTQDLGLMMQATSCFKRRRKRYDDPAKDYKHQGEFPGVTCHIIICRHLALYRTVLTVCQMKPGVTSHLTTLCNITCSHPMPKSTSNTAGFCFSFYSEAW